MAEAGQALAAAVDEQRAQARQGRAPRRRPPRAAGSRRWRCTIALPQPGDSRLNANANGATEPSSERRLSAGVRLGWSPCASPADEHRQEGEGGIEHVRIEAVAHDAQQCRGRTPPPSPTAIVVWYAAGPTMSPRVISSVAPATSSQTTQKAIVCRNARMPTAAAATSRERQPEPERREHRAGGSARRRRRTSASSTGKLRSAWADPEVSAADAPCAAWQHEIPTEPLLRRRRIG